MFVDIPIVVLIVDLVCAVIVVVGVVVVSCSGFKFSVVNAKDVIKVEVGRVVKIIGSFDVTDVVVKTEAKEGVFKDIKDVDDAVEVKVEGCVVGSSNEWEGPKNVVVIAVDVSVVIGIEAVTDGEEVTVDVISDPDDSIVPDSDPAVGSPRNLKALKRKGKLCQKKV